MCFGGKKSTNNVVTPAYPATYEAGAGAVQQDYTTEKANVSGHVGAGLSDRPTQADVTSAPRGSGAVGLNVKGM